VSSMRDSAHRLAHLVEALHRLRRLRRINARPAWRYEQEAPAWLYEELVHEAVHAQGVGRGGKFTVWLSAVVRSLMDTAVGAVADILFFVAFLCARVLDTRFVRCSAAPPAELPLPVALRALCCCVLTAAPPPGGVSVATTV
jgi:hypothetical protein